MKLSVIKRCACGATYTRSTWRKLPFVGIWEHLELRNCTCSSTLAVPA